MSARAWDSRRDKFPLARYLPARLPDGEVVLGRLMSKTEAATNRRRATQMRRYDRRLARWERRHPPTLRERIEAMGGVLDEIELFSYGPVLAAPWSLPTAVPIADMHAVAGPELRRKVLDIIDEIEESG